MWILKCRYVFVIFTCHYFGQVLQESQASLDAMEKWGLSDPPVPLVPQVDQGKPVQV